jgi:nucleotide sugar dehydrogenase
LEIENILETNRKVLIIGLGQIGYNNAKYMSSIGLRVDGFDISEKAIQRALNDGVIQKKCSSFKDYDYYILCISTHNPKNMYIPHMDDIFRISEQLFYEGKSGSLICIESTIDKGTTSIVKDIVKHKLHVVHCPHRFYEKEKEKYGVNQKRVLGGSVKCCLDEGRKFYKDSLGIPIHEVKHPEVAELSKIIENSYRFLEISFAEELKMICQHYGYDFGDVRRAVNTKWNINILEARDGIDGHCLPKDSQMYLDLTRKIFDINLIGTAKIIDDLYKKKFTEFPVLSPKIVEEKKLF